VYVCIPRTSIYPVYIGCARLVECSFERSSTKFGHSSGNNSTMVNHLSRSTFNVERASEISRRVTESSSEGEVPRNRRILLFVG